MKLRSIVATAVIVALVIFAHPQPVRASAQPVCTEPRIVRSGSLRMFYSTENGGYTKFTSKGGGVYGVDPNSIPEELMNRLKPNGPSLAARVAGRTCDDRIFYIERVLVPVSTQLRAYTP